MRATLPRAVLVLLVALGLCAAIARYRYQASTATSRSAATGGPEHTSSLVFGSLPQVYCMAFSPDGKLIVAGTIGGVLVVWEYPSGKELWSKKRRKGSVSSVAICRSDHGLAVVSSETAAGSPAAVLLWEPRTGRLIRNLADTLGEVRCAAVSSDGKWLVLEADQMGGPWEVVVRSAQSRQVAFSARWQDFVPSDIAFSQDGRVMAVCGMKEPLKDEPTGVVLSWATTRWRKTGEFEWPNNSRERPIGHPIPAVTCSPDGSRLAVAVKGEGVFVTDPQFRDWKVLSGDDTGSRDLAFTPDGDRVVSAGSDGTVKVWDVASQQCIRTLNGHNRREGGVNCVSVAPDGTVVASGGDDGKVLIWDPNSGRCRKELVPLLNLGLAGLQRMLDEKDDFELCDSVFCGLGKEEFDLTHCSEIERVVSLVWHVSGLIGNGGFGYLFSADLRGDPGYIHSVEAFDAIGAKKAASAFREALGLFPNGTLPKDIDERLRVYDLVPENERDQIDRQFFDAHDEVSRRLAAYIRKNRTTVEQLLEECARRGQ